MSRAALGVSSKLRHRRKVLFPEPEDPNIEITSPFDAEAEMLFNISILPKLLCKFSIINVGRSFSCTKILSPVYKQTYIHGDIIIVGECRSN